MQRIRFDPYVVGGYNPHRKVNAHLAFFLQNGSQLNNRIRQEIIMVRCHYCDQEVSNANGILLDPKGKEVKWSEALEGKSKYTEAWVCGVCAGKTEPCHCGSHNIVLDDFGVMKCQKCYDEMTVEQRDWLNGEAHNEAMDMGYF